ncbi:hypothetical protein CC78DRAFT_533597 [Lojkania enalia]|uniref:Uncharacterized protein n=1 Tax=Lojkania enalia TaxID=147567 RepID=A0A9P4N321_9PLEO|nr:hypothetical protein CC78DRAFT_533597 [Didymosphaeria enalia]
MSLLDIDRPAALVRGCITNKIKGRDIIEALGLKNLNPKQAAPKFDSPDASELYRDIGSAVVKLTDFETRSPAQLQDDLVKPDVLHEPVNEISNKFGEKIWGRLKRTHLIGSDPKSFYRKSLYWDLEEDQKIIKLYLRCWIVKRAARRIGDEQRKLKEGQRSHSSAFVDRSGTKKIISTDKRINISDDSSDESSSDGALKVIFPPTLRGKAIAGSLRSPSGGIHLAAPVRSSLGQAPTTQAETTERQPCIENASEANEAESLHTNRPALEVSNNFARPDTPSTAKRKRAENEDRSGRGKLPKVNLGRTTMSELLKEAQRDEDPYRIPRSPSTVFGAEPLPPRFGRRRNTRADTQESDPSYRPSTSGSVESDQPDVDHRITETIESILSCSRPIDNSIKSVQNLPTIRPTATRRPSPRDSVIPLDIRDEDTNVTVDLTTPQPEHESVQVRPITVVLRKSFPPELEAGEEGVIRMELFKLLLSRLNNLHQFAHAGHHASEERLDLLLDYFWKNDRAQIQAKYCNDFGRLEGAFESWMQMRTRLNAFQAATKYFGHPGQEWREHLRTIAENSKRAELCIAHVDLHSSRGAGPGNCSFDDDLRTIFDELTKYPGCNGAEEFGGIKEYNEKLLAWFR